MKKLTLFYLPSCPYCRQAFGWLEELAREKPEYTSIPLTTINEAAEPELADSYDYYYVPCLYADGIKCHEGAATKEKLRAVLEDALTE